MADGSVTIDTSLNNNGFKKGLNALGSMAKIGLKSVFTTAGVVAGSFAGIVTASVKARGEIEQSIGGVETLFKNSADKVVKNAKKAHKTAGLSANEYMQNVTSFSASLLQSVAGDTSKAADIADMAMVDMSDNANKMGTDMASIQNAYQGFAKQNYTMLDNLKLGYGGTKTEMERLLKDAQKLTGVKYDINNLSDVYEAIHVIQNELGITGTTAKEAEKTLTGSISALKASWDNFLSGSGSLGDVFNSATVALDNIIRIISDAVPDILENITDWLPDILETGVQLAQQLIQGIVQKLPEFITIGMEAIKELILGISQMLPELIPQAVECVITIVEGLIDNIDMLIEAGIELIIALAEGLIEALPKLIEKIPVIIEKLLDAIVRNFPKIIKAGGELIAKLAIGIMESNFKLVQVAPKLISNLVNGLKRGWAEMKNIGKYFIEGLWNGISNMTSWIFDKIKGFKDAVLNKFKSFFGIHSPSKVFRDEIGEYLALGIGEGFDDNIGEVYKKMKSAVDFETQKLSTNLTTTQVMNVERTDNISTRLESIDNNKDINVNSTLEVDGKTLANVVNKVNATQKLAYGLS